MVVFTLELVLCYAIGIRFAKIVARLQTALRFWGASAAHLRRPLLFSFGGGALCLSSSWGDSTQAVEAGSQQFFASRLVVSSSAPVAKPGADESHSDLRLCLRHNIRSGTECSLWHPISIDDEKKVFGGHLNSSISVFLNEAVRSADQAGMPP